MEDETDEDGDEKRLGARLSAFRTAASLSQKALAQEMKLRGWRWSQPTVAAIEKGDRPLRATELPALVEIFGLFDVDAFYDESAAEVARAALNELVRRATELEDAAREYLLSQWKTATRIDQAIAASAQTPSNFELLLFRTPVELVSSVELHPETPQDRLAKEGMEFLGRDGNWHQFGSFANSAATLRRLIASNPDVLGKRQQPDLSPSMWRKPAGQT